MRIVYFFSLIIFIVFQPLESFEKVVIWGYKLDSHTHSYIHYGFYRAFQHLKYPTYWFDDKDDVGQFDFSKTLFITIGGQEERIPLREDCEYILHNCESSKYHFLKEKGKAISMQVYTDDVLSRNTTKIDDFIYYDIPGKCVYMPWATDLLPHEIDERKAKVPHLQRKKIIYWVGTIGGGVFGNSDQLQGFINACKKNHVIFEHNNPWVKAVSLETHCDLIASSYMAPAIVGEWQKKQGYIPCRIFKNISYGQMGVTNSKHVFELFKGKIVYNADTNQLFYDAEKRMKNMKIDELYELMDFVKTKHTYLNRIQTLLEFFTLIQPGPIPNVTQK